MQQTRRAFLAEVGQGMVIASIGPALAADMGLAVAWGAESPARLTFGRREELVCLMQETPPAKLLPLAVERLRQGTKLQELVAAAALANARTFGGEDYVGFHTMMALTPSYYMARDLPTERAALPVLKVLYRNSNRIQEKGGRKSEILHAVTPAELPANQPGQEALKQAIYKKDRTHADQLLAGLAQRSADEAFNDLLYTVDDYPEVHRVVLAYRSWDMFNLLGREEAQTLLRQSVHYCIDAENWPHHPGDWLTPRKVLPKLMDQYHLPATATRRHADDAWINKMAETIFRSTPEQAAEAVAAALAEGWAPAFLGEAITLAANQLVLRDNGRPANHASPGKPAGSIHGDSIGVHASDSANAWRNISRASNPRNQAASLILGAYQVAKDRLQRGGQFLEWLPYPRPEHQKLVQGKEPKSLLQELESAIRNKDQAHAAAVVQRCEQVGAPAEPLFALMLGYAISEDGALHAEKYYRTTFEEFNAVRPKFRWRHLIGLARVTASAYGQPAPGYEEARQLLKV
jgi:hypothetical protein